MTNAKAALHLSRYCDQSKNEYIFNLTSSYGDQAWQRNEATMAAASVIMFVLAGLFFNLNLFSGLSDVSAILDPKVRLLLSSALSLFLPVMSYLFSEAKNATAAGAGALRQRPELSVRAGFILIWMLLVELLRKKVDEIRMHGYSGTLQRAGRVVWLGSLVFFNIQSAGRKAVFGILWVLCAAKLLQRIAYTEVGKRSYAYGKNARLVSSYMYKILGQPQDHRQVDVPVEPGSNEDLLKRCKYVVAGEEDLIIEATADGYELKDLDHSPTVVTVGRIWELASSPECRAFTRFDPYQRLRRLCLSFALFKLLRRRFEHLPEMTKEEARDCRDLIFKGVYNNGACMVQAHGGHGGENKAAREPAEQVFEMMNDEVNFLSEYYHSVVPVVFASPFFFLANYFLLPVVVLGLCLMNVVLCGNGNMPYIFGIMKTDNIALSSGIFGTTLCLLTKAFSNVPAFFSAVDMFITFLLFIIFFYEEIWEFVVILLSNWFMVSLLCNYAAREAWRDSPTFTAVVRRILWVRRRMGHPVLSIRQFSVLSLRWPLLVELPATLAIMVGTVPVPIEVKKSIMEYLVEHHGAGAGDEATPLSNGKSALERNHLSGQLSWACASDSVAEVVLTWHIATSILETKCPPAAVTATSMEAAAARSRMVVAMSLSMYCAYLVAFQPELLPDNQEKAEVVFEGMKQELRNRLGCWEYYFWRRRARVEKIMETTGGREKKVVRNGATLATALMGLETTAAEKWKVLADVWTELVVFMAPSSDEERVMGHEKVLVQGGEFITVLWALTTHTGIARPPKSSASIGRPKVLRRRTWTACA